MIQLIRFAFTALTVTTSLWAKQPNVIIIYTDDQGSVDLNCYGSKDLKTPHMDALAKSGTRFTQFYSPAPICSASRAGLMTGMTPAFAGVPNNVGLSSEGLPSAQVTIAEEFKKAGYNTAHIGKWHLGHHKGTVPNGQGFDYSFGHLVGCIDNFSHFFYWSGPNKHDLWRNGKEVFHNGEFFPELMVKEAGQFIEQHQKKPFFMYFAINCPHYPYQGTSEWLKHYKDLPYPRNLYAAFLSTMDDHIGALVKKIDDLGIREDTIIVFQSDHGHSVETRAHGGGGSAGPYQGHKGNLYEGGIRVPAIISWKGHLPENEVRGQMATGCDWYPTLLDLCQLPVADHPLAGKSIVSVIKSAKATTPHQIFHWRHSKQTMVRSGKWKLMIKNGARSELFDIPNDPGESNNLAKQHSDVVNDLTEKSKAYWRKLK